MKDNLDSLWLTKRYLEGYRGQRGYISLLESEIQDRYETATNMIAIYGEHIGHSSVERLHPGARLAIDLEFQEKRSALAEAQRIIDTIDKSMADLSPIEQKIIEMRYVAARTSSWIAVSREVGYSERSCRYLHRKSLRHIAIALFGLNAVFKAEKKSLA